MRSSHRCAEEDSLTVLVHQTTLTTLAPGSYTGHMPAYAAPGKLADALVEVATMENSAS
jgi:hypothetical protein